MSIPCYEKITISAKKKKETNVKNDPIISGVNTALISSMLPWNVTQLEFNNMSLSIFNTDSTFLLHHNLKLVSLFS